MGAQVTKEKQVKGEKRQLKEQASTTEPLTFPGSDFHHPNPKVWMSTLPLQNLRMRDVVWPGTHDSATNKIGFPMVSRPFARCQKLSVYDQLCIGVRMLDIRVQQDRKQLGEYLVPQDGSFFGRPLIELLPKRVICIWRPRQSPAPSPGSPLWSSAYIKDNWIDTDLPLTKFHGNVTNLQKQPPNDQRTYFYRVENTATPQITGPILCVYPVTNRIRGYARLFLAEVFKQGLGDRLQIFSGDFVDQEFVDACIGVTIARNNLQMLQPAAAAA
jgi:hypothetical protein